MPATSCFGYLFLFKGKTLWIFKNLNQGGEPSCVPDGEYARQDSNLLNFPLKRAYQLQKIKERRIKTKMSNNRFTCASCCTILL
nr:MAG TPA: hypothetical protein [Bacteriophage sp.]